MTDFERLEHLAEAVLDEVRRLRAAGADDAQTPTPWPRSGPCGRTDSDARRCQRGHDSHALRAGAMAAIGTHAFWPLWRGGYHTSEAVRAASDLDLLCQRNFGARSLERVRDIFGWAA